MTFHEASLVTSMAIIKLLIEKKIITAEEFENKLIMKKEETKKHSGKLISDVIDEWIKELKGRGVQ